MDVITEKQRNHILRQKAAAALRATKARQVFDTWEDHYGGKCAMQVVKDALTPIEYLDFHAMSVPVKHENIAPRGLGSFVIALNDKQRLSFDEIAKIVENIEEYIMEASDAYRL